MQNFPALSDPRTPLFERWVLGATLVLLADGPCASVVGSQRGPSSAPRKTSDSPRFPRRAFSRQKARQRSAQAWTAALFASPPRLARRVWPDFLALALPLARRRASSMSRCRAGRACLPRFGV